MAVRLALPVAAVAFTFGAVGGCSSITPSDQMAQDSSSAQIRPAQMTEVSHCDELAQQVQGRMPTAKAYRVPYAEKDLRQAQELCHSGQSERGISILEGALNYMDQEP